MERKSSGGKGYEQQDKEKRGVMSDGVLVQTGQGESFMSPLSSDPKKVKERSM